MQVSDRTLLHNYDMLEVSVGGVLAMNTKIVNQCRVIKLDSSFGMLGNQNLSNQR
jgi:hypothetical protein